MQTAAGCCRPSGRPDRRWIRHHGRGHARAQRRSVPPAEVVSRALERRTSRVPVRATSPARWAASPASAWSAVDSSTCAVSATAIRWRCSTVRRCPARSRCAASVPLDLFPTDLIASSLVQKTYSPNYPGEFGGGVINLTTLAIPEHAVPERGRRHGWGHRDHQPPRLRPLRQQVRLDRIRQRQSRPAAGAEHPSSTAASGSARAMSTPAPSRSEFVNWHNGLVQKIDGMPVNFSASRQRRQFLGCWRFAPGPHRHRGLQQQMAHARQHRADARAASICR